jgi:hypothetical protein
MGKKFAVHENQSMFHPFSFEKGAYFQRNVAGKPQNRQKYSQKNEAQGSIKQAVQKILQMPLN